MTEVETGVLNAYGTTFLRWLQLECLLYKLRHNTVLSSSKPIRLVAFQLAALVMCDTERDTIARIWFHHPVHTHDPRVTSTERRMARRELVGLPPVSLTLDWAAKHAVEELEVPQYQQQDRKPEDGHEVQC